MRKSVLVAALCGAPLIVGLTAAAVGAGRARSSLAAVPDASNSTPGDSLIALEKLSWAAWKSRDSKFFQRFLSADHVEIQSSGRATKAVVVAGVGSPACVVSSYSYDNFKVTFFAPTIALVSYHAAQNTLCGGQRVPSPVWVGSLYVKRGDKWENAAYQQTAAPPPAKE